MGNLCSKEIVSKNQTKTVFNCANHRRPCTSKHLICEGHSLCPLCEYQSITKKICIYCLRSLNDFELAFKDKIEKICFSCNSPATTQNLICNCFLCSKCIPEISLLSTCPMCSIVPKLIKKNYPCIVCTSEFTRDEMLTLNCDHYFCQTCIEYHIKIYIQERTRDLRMNKGIPCFNCETFLDIHLIQSVLSAEDFEKYNRILIEANECPKCKLPYFTDEQKIICSRCKYFFCDSCLKAADKCDCNNEVVITGIDMSACPGCRSLYAKDEGCNHVKCMKKGCREEFCFLCSAVRSPTLVHGNHYHRPQCKFYSEYNGNDDKFNKNCKMCVKAGSLCIRPKNLKIPRRINIDEI